MSVEACYAAMASLAFILAIHCADLAAPAHDHADQETCKDDGGDRYESLARSDHAQDEMDVNETPDGTNTGVRAISNQSEDDRVLRCEGPLASTSQPPGHRTTRCVDLPRELRDKVYTYVLKAEGPLPALDIRLIRGNYIWTASLRKPALAFVSKSICAEVLHIYFSTNIFSLTGLPNPEPILTKVISRWRSFLEPWDASPRHVQFEMNLIHATARKAVGASSQSRSRFHNRFNIGLAANGPTVHHLAHLAYFCGAMERKDSARCVYVPDQKLQSQLGEAGRYDGAGLLRFVETMLGEEDVAVGEIQCEMCGRLRFVSARTSLPLFAEAASRAAGRR